jgi:hypothetical protein
MPMQYGTDRGFVSTNTGGVVDGGGNSVISSSNEFGASPLGPAALAQTLFSVANGTFNLLPANSDAIISPSNPLPYWDVPIDDSDGLMSGKIIFDETTNTYALRLTPGTALSGDTYAITTRSAVISDDNLALRQKAIATLEKVGTYAGTTQVNLSLSATYYDHTGSAISTQAIGTVFDNGTISSITGFTTAGTAAVGISASYVDLTFTMTATANVTSGISFDINTILLQTSQGGGGGSSSFILTETFQASGDFVVPTGVEYLLAVFAISGGGGGGGGGAMAQYTTSVSTRGGGGGGGGRSALIQNLYIGGAGGTISVGVGAGGSGGTAASYAKGTGNFTEYFLTGGNGSAGGATTFGSYLTLNGGSAATGGGTTNPSGVGGTSVTTSIGVYRGLGASGAAGGNQDSNAQSGISGADNIPWGAETYIGLGANGGSASATGTAGGTRVIDAPGTATTTVGIQGGGGGGNSPDTNVGTAGSGRTGGGGGGGGVYWAYNSAPTEARTLIGGVGGIGGVNSGSGGGGGGGVRYQDNQTTYRNYTVGGTAGAGGAGGSGLVVVVYVG